jgi:hypothetical protein
LKETSHTPNTPAVPGAQRLRGRVRGRLVSRFQPGGDNRRLRVTPIGTGLFVLVASTTLAIAFVSIWWVPAYLGLLVLIFVTPPSWHPPSSASESGVESDTAGIADLGRDLRMDSADGLDEIRSISQFDLDPTIVDPTESSVSNPDVSTGGAAKRRGRVRARKPTNPANEPVTDSLPVVWIQVGPGKFVRVEGGIQTADPARTSVSESVTEEHGIAPSAFSLTTEIDSSVEGSPDELLDQLEHPQTQTADPAESDSTCLSDSADLGPPLCRPGVSRTWVKRIQRGIVRTIPRVNRVSTRHNTPASPNPRLRVGPSYALNVSRHDAAFRAFGRVLHVQNIIRTRSPPRR